MNLVIKSVLVLVLCGLTACGSKEDQGNRLQAPASENQALNHEHNHKHSGLVTLKNKYCRLEKAKMSDFEVVCPVDIEKIRYGFITSGNGISLSNTSINGVLVSLSVKKVGSNRVAGKTKNHHLSLELILADGTSEFIQVD